MFAQRQKKNNGILLSRKEIVSLTVSFWNAFISEKGDYFNNVSLTLNEKKLWNNYCQLRLLCRFALIEDIPQLYKKFQCTLGQCCVLPFKDESLIQTLHSGGKNKSENENENENKKDGQNDNLSEKFYLLWDGMYKLFKDSGLQQNENEFDLLFVRSIVSMNVFSKDVMGSPKCVGFFGLCFLVCGFWFVVFLFDFTVCFVQGYSFVECL